MRTFDEIPPGITADLIRQSVVEYDIHQTPHPYKASTDYDVIIDDRPYPPVAIMGIASSLAEGTQECPELKGGEGTPCFKKWEELGFEIVPKETHQGHEANRKNPRSWIDCLEVLNYQNQGYDPRELFSLCLRERNDYTLNNYLGISASGKASGGSHKFIWPAMDNFSKVQVGFKVKGVGLYLVVDSIDEYFVETVKQSLSDKLREPFVWPDPQVGKSYRAFVVNLETLGQYQSVIEWLSSERVQNVRRLGFRESKTSKLRTEKPELFESTSDEEELEAKVTELLKEGLDEEPEGNPQPERSDPREGKGAFKRAGGVIAYVKQRSQGVCEKCDQPAPFIDRQGQPYLEVHHIIPLAEDGPDLVSNAVALCPNCHRECHSGPDVEGIRELLFSKLSHQ